MIAETARMVPTITNIRSQKSYSKLVLPLIASSMSESVVPKNTWPNVVGRIPKRPMA